MKSNTPDNNFISSDVIRAKFSAAMSHMYRAEVPAYGDLIKIVQQTNEASLHISGLSQHPEDTRRLSDERHGAIRVGTAQELAMLGRMFAIMGMYPVSYYDLGSAGIPVHSTAFRPTSRAALAANPFRVFTSLLRLELIENEAVRDTAQQVLASRNIFHDEAVRLTEQAEADGGLNEADATDFVTAALETFRWTGKARVHKQTYDELHELHRLIADVVAFQGPHINHLTPRTLDIDKAQQAMRDASLPAKAVIEGPPQRQCPILLRQTSFKALTEPVQFLESDDMSGHTARFGEIEARGIALTPKGRALYDRLLAETRAEITPAADGSNAAEYTQKLAAIFSAFPDDWRQIHDEGLGYFRYQRAAGGRGAITASDLPQALDDGIIALAPIIYEDFLPVSAAGIFQSNLGDEATQATSKQASQTDFEAALGTPVLDEFTHYQQIADASLAEALQG